MWPANGGHRNLPAQWSAEHLKKTKLQWSIPESREAVSRSFEADEVVRIDRHFSLCGRSESLERRMELFGALRFSADSRVTQAAQDGYVEAEKLFDDALAVRHEISNEFSATFVRLWPIADIVTRFASIAATRGEFERWWRPLVGV